MFKAPVVILPQYCTSPTEPSFIRRAAVLTVQLLVAALYGCGAVYLPPEYRFVLILPIGLCVLIAFWMMPERGLSSITAVERSYRPFLVLLVVWPAYIAVVLPGLPWLTPTRMVLLAVVFFFLYSLSTSGALRSYLLAVVRSSQLFWAAFLTWQASMIISLPFSHQLGQSAKMLVDRTLALTTVFFVGCLVFARPGAATRTLRWLIALAMICSVEGFVELRMGYPPWAFHIPSFMKIDEEALGYILGAQARASDGLYRVRGPFTVSLLFAEFLALCTPFVLHWLLTGRSLFVRFSMPFIWALFLAAILSTQSRLGLIGTMVAIATYVPLWAVRQRRQDRNSLLGASLLVGAPLIALMLVGIVFSSHTLTMRVLGGGAQAPSTEARNEQRRLAVPKVLANPLGHGLGTVGIVLGFVTPEGRVTVDDDYVKTALDLGVLGVVGFYGMFMIASFLAAKQYLSAIERESELAGPLASMFVVFIVIKFVLAEEANHSLVILLLGMAMALRARDLKLAPEYLRGISRIT